jgi:hypothetical protein
MIMKYRLMLSALFLALTPAALASNTWYVNGVAGSDSNDCKSATTACKTIGHAISLASSGDTIMVAAATYTENPNTGLLILNFVGAGASTTIIDGGGNGTVLTTEGGSISGVTIQNGAGGGIGTAGSLTILNSVISGNSAPNGAGVYIVGGTLTISNSTISGNNASFQGGGVFVFTASLVVNKSTISGNTSSFGGGILCSAGIGSTMLISNSTISGNKATSGTGGGILPCNGSINNSTISGNTASVGTVGNGDAGQGGGIYVAAELFLNNDTIAGNSAQASGASGGGIYVDTGGAAILQNTIVAGNGSGNNCGGSGTFTSNGYNLGGDSTCHFTGPGDLNNANPRLGPLQNNGGPTQTMALGNGSLAIDAGNPSGCTDNKGNLLKFDQRGTPRPDKDDTSGCDIGAYESQN